MSRQIVVGVDGSQPAERALVWAADAASRDDAQLVIAHGGDVLPKAELALDGGHDYSRDLLRDAVATAIDVGGTCNVSTVLRQQGPAELLLELSDGARRVQSGRYRSRSSATAPGAWRIECVPRIVTASPPLVRPRLGARLETVPTAA